MFHLFPHFHKIYNNALSISPPLYLLKYFDIVTREKVSNIWYINYSEILVLTENVYSGYNFIIWTEWNWPKLKNSQKNMVTLWEIFNFIEFPTGHRWNWQNNMNHDNVKLLTRQLLPLVDSPPLYLVKGMRAITYNTLMGSFVCTC